MASSAAAAAAAAAGWLVSPALQCLTDKAKSYADAHLRYFPSGGAASSDLDRLQAALLHLHAAASALERRRPSDPTLLAWLHHLKDAAHDADDLLDDLHYARLLDSSLSAPRQKLRRLLDSSRSLCRRLIGVEQPLNRLPSLLDRLTVLTGSYASLIHLVELDAAASPRHGHQFAKNSSSVVSADDTVFGRGRELAELVGRLVGCNGHAQVGNQRVPVVAIVGDGGIGKTTLAQMAYNHVCIEQLFELRMWVCVSSRVDEVELTREILQLATEASEGKDHDGVVNFDRLQKLLVSAVEGRRFLLVLDDVWDDKERTVWENTERWRRLLAPLQNGERDSRIVVTSRMKMVAGMLGARSAMVLDGLGSEEHWLLLKKCALGDEKTCEYPQLQEVGRKIALKLRGSPLSAKVIGGMLNGTRSARDWYNVLETQIHGDIVSTLLSSYYHLPQQLQYCFAYCSIFPKNSKFVPRKLIKMWMSQGFIQLELHRSLEDVGRDYFNQLLSRSFFQRLRQGSKTYYLIHDLMHDLAQMVSACDCMRVEGGMSKNIPPTVRHLSVASNSLAHLKNQFDLKRLRTLMIYRDPLVPSNPVPDDFLAEVKNVRALDLTGCSMLELTEAIGQLTHLRYMALPDTIERLPESVSKLLHLQSLDIPKKCRLDKVPEGMHHLTSLRHLGIDSKHIAVIKGIGSLVNLQGSIEFHVKKEKGQTLEELKDMKDLHGLLNIKNLDNVQSKEEACKAQLVNKQNVKILKLEWNSASAGFGPTMDAEVLDCLQPHPNLEELHITRYKGASSPSWLLVKMLYHLKSLYLTNCRRWEILPPLGQLPSLKVLHLKEMCSVTEIDLKFYGSGMIIFPSLKDLLFDDMPNLVSWTGETNDSFFPRLQKLKLSNCPKLIQMPLLPSTTKRVVVERSKNISHLNLSPYCSSKSSKFKLEISTTVVLKEGFLQRQHLAATEVLYIRGCWGSLVVEEFQLLRSLRKLRLCQYDMDDGHLSLCLQNLTGLASLELVDCQNIKSFLFPAGSRHLITLQHLCFQGCSMLSSLAKLESFIFLRSLIIEKCPGITVSSLPADMRKMAYLNKLIISHCPELQSLPNKGLPSSLEFLYLIGCHPLLTKQLLEEQGSEWEKISFISNITIS